MPRVPDAGQLQIMQLDDLVKAIVWFLRPEAPSRVQLDIAGPERLSFGDVVAAYRNWLGWKPARQLHVPRWFTRVMYRLGDFAGWLGWRPPIRSTAEQEIKRGAIGDPAPWTSMTGIVPRSLETSFTAEPASVQEKWFARLYLLKPDVLGVFSFFWITTAFMSLGPGWDIGIALTHEGGVTGIAAAQTVIAGALADLCIGIGTAFRRTARPALYAAIALSLAYVVMGTILVPPAVDRSARANVEDLAGARPESGRIGDPRGPVMTYFILHVIGASVLLGTGAGIPFFMLLGHLTAKPVVVAAIARVVVIADCLFTASAVVVQPISGGALAWHMGWSLWEGWLALSIALYLVTGAFWLPAVWMQMRMRDLATEAAMSNQPLPAVCHRLFWWWFAFGFPAFGAVIAS